MKLVFPGGEHPQVVLKPGANQLGSAPESLVVLDHPGVAPRHCQLHLGPSGVMLDVPPGAQVSVNGRPVNGLMALRDGDSLFLDQLEARLTSLDPANDAAPVAPAAMPAVAPATATAATPPAAAPAAQAAAPANDELFVTTVRQALPRFVMRGVSGSMFGRTFPLLGVVTIGRSPECTLRIDEPGISRMHARLVPTEAGVLMEDLGSTNGSFINGQRVLRGELSPGDEVGFDTLRFRLAPAGQSHGPVQVPAQATRREAASGGGKGVWIGVGVAALAVVATTLFLVL